MSSYKSEIRDGDIKSLSERVRSASYGSYLKTITLVNVRSFKQRQISFDFPVTALIGPNGGGKTTILGAAGLVYSEVKPRRFFTKSGKYDSSMKDWRIEYELIDKTLNRGMSLRRTASFPKLKWNRTGVDRHVLIFGVARTVPASERIDLNKAAGGSFRAKREVALTEPVIKAVGMILGKAIDGYSQLFVDAAGKVKLLAAKNPSGTAYSEFHFGAGEASVISMVSQIEAAEEGTLILIEEIENGLHPVATRAMVDYLIEVAKRKSCQVIFTTHSNDALELLPSSAIWSAYDGEVLQGKLDIRALGTITGQIEAKLAIFVEDDFAAELITMALRHSNKVEMGAIKVHGMGGAGTAIKVNRQHNIDPTRTFPSVCFVDGDQAGSADTTHQVYVLPGTDAPDAHIFKHILSRLDTEAARLTAGMHFPTTEQENVKRVIRSRALTNHDRHIIYAQIGEDLGFTAELIVKTAFLAVWAQTCPEEVASIVDNIPLEILDSLRPQGASAITQPIP